MDIVVLPGDGIGPEITAATLGVMAEVDDRYKLDLSFETREIGLETLAETGTTLPDGVLDRLRRSHGAIMGPVSHADYPPREQGGINPSGEFRIKLDLYANLRPARARPGLAYVRRPMDLIIVRENTEGFYSDRNMFLGPGEFMPTPDMALSLRKITAHGSSRIARTAFEIARRRRKVVTAVHKANVLKVSEALFLREVRKVAAEFLDVRLEEQLVDSMAALLIRAPDRFDVVVTTNMYGDILSDEASELSGSLGLAGGLNAGVDRAIAQAQHGSAPDIAGQDKANPASLILSAAMLLDWLGTRHNRLEYIAAGAAINAAIDRALADPGQRTGDLGGPLGTRAFAGRVADLVRAGAA